MDDHLNWENLPPHLRDAIAERVGAEPEVRAIPAGHGEFAASVYGRHDEVFLKAIPTASPSAYLHKRERWAARHLPASAPASRMAWEMEAGGSGNPAWHVTAWELNEHARPVDLQRGTCADVPIVLDTVAQLGKLLTPCPQGARTIVQRLQPMAAKAQAVLRLRSNAIHYRSLYERALNGFVIDRLNGRTLLHGNLSARHLLIKDQVVSVVGWSQVCAGQAWIEPALLVPHLVARHWPPQEVHSLLGAIPAWRDVPPGLVAGMTAVWTLFHLHEGHLADEPQEGSVRLADAGRRWLTHLVAQL
uniref:hypothetical protein n=1 Tax=Nonomuraea sp. CA-252377 TaxID=3240003 RepID=UPI003F495D9F